MPKAGGRGGRPLSGDEHGTRQIRVFEDIADKIAWIVRVRGGSAAQLLDPLIRPEIESLYHLYEDAIKRIMAAEDALRKTEEEAVAQAKLHDSPIPKGKKSRG